MNEIHCIDETLDINSTSLYNLSIQVNLDGFCFSILNTVNNKYIVLKYFPFPSNISNEVIYDKIEAIIKNEELLNKNYKSVKTSYITRKYTVIPDEFYDIKASTSAFKLNHYLNELDELHINELHDINSKLLFAVPNQVANLIYNQFQNVKYFHHCTPMMNYMFKNQTKEDVIRINVNDNFFDLIIASDKILKFHNTFLYKTPVDIIYYILNVLKSLTIDTEKSNIIFSGFVSKSGEIIKTAKQYFNSIKFQTPDNKFVYSYTFNKIPSHTFVNLLNLEFCE